MSTSAPTMQACRACGAGASLDAHFCPQCRTILPLVRRQTDYFTFFGLPRLLCLEASDLEQRFRTLSRQFHPDYFYNAAPAERLASLERSSYLNDAYRTLKSPVARVEYLLSLEGIAAKSPEEAARQVPPALLEEVFALNEELDEVREIRAAGAPAETWRSRLERARLPIDAKREEHERQLQELSARWDELAGRAASTAVAAAAHDRREVLQALQERVLERNYINNLLAGIERELNP